MENSFSLWKLVTVKSCLLFCAFTALEISAEETERQRLARVLKSYESSTIDIPAISGPINIDGDLKDESWKSATAIDIGWQTSPISGVRSKIKSTAYIMEDGEKLYVGFKIEDPNPDKIRAYLRNRDALFADDFVSFSIDTNGDGTRAFEFFSNALGVQGDAIADLHKGEDFSYEAIFETGGKITSEGFEVEFAIGLNQIRFPKRFDKQQWKLLFSHAYTRDQRYQSFQYPHDRENNCFICQFQPAEGLIGATPGKQLHIVPTVTANSVSIKDPYNIASDATNISYNVGIDDFRWGITPDLTINGTVNPDFSQIELDVAQSSINKNFVLYYPEKRPFFLEGRSFFNTPFNLLNTRNIADPNYGAKITGKVDANVYGLLTARDRITNILIADSQSSSVKTLEQELQTSTARYRRDFSDSSYMGVLVTDRQGRNYNNQVVSIDSHYRIGTSDSIDFQFASSNTDNPDELVSEFDIDSKQQDRAYRISYRHSSSVWSWGLKRDYYGRDFRADAGFINQVDMVLSHGFLNYKIAGQSGDFINRLTMGVYGQDAKTEAKGDFLNRGYGAFANLSLPGNSWLYLSRYHREQAYNKKLFYLQSNSIGFGSRAIHGITYNTNIYFGDQIDYDNTRIGNYFQINQRIEYNINKHLLLRLRYNYRKLKVHGDKIFVNRLSDLRITYQFDLKSFLRLTLIHDDTEKSVDLYQFDVDAKSTNMDAQVLYSYQLNPQTALYLGYSTSSIDNDTLNSMSKTGDTVFAKFSYAWGM